LRETERPLVERERERQRDHLLRETERERDHLLRETERERDHLLRETESERDHLLRETESERDHLLRETERDSLLCKVVVEFIMFSPDFEDEFHMSTLLMCREHIRTHSTEKTFYDFEDEFHMSTLVPGIAFHGIDRKCSIGNIYL
jgi:hypothetical protein